MKKITTILSPLVLLATTALAQDSTCILQPSCSQLGYTSSETDCGTQKVLRCPFDVSQVACLSGGSDSGGSGAGGDNYNPNDPNNELGDVIAVKIVIPSTGSATFTYGGGNIYVDCGDGTIVGGSAGSSGTITCTYSTAGTFIAKLSGDFTYYGGCPTSVSLIKLDKSGITKISKVCGSTTNGVVPPLPSTLVDATSMFDGCSAINSPYPKLPATLEIADNMFKGATKFTGSIALPESLKSAKAMFSGSTGLQSVTGLENTKITDGTSMFESSSITSVAELPKNLTIGRRMFYKSTITSVPGLPETLTDGHEMFYNCSSLTTLPNLPDGLTDGYSMFYQCSNMEGTVNSLPSALVVGSMMFYGATKITGSPAKPAGLTVSNCGSAARDPGCYGGIFSYTGVQVDWY